jgi:hypothetical protein
MTEQSFFWEWALKFLRKSDYFLTISEFRICLGKIADKKNQVYILSSV